ncbi:MAG: hypothetical protein ACR2GQ_02310 [Gemmatimonadota bacterium]
MGLHIIQQDWPHRRERPAARLLRYVNRADDHRSEHFLGPHPHDVVDVERAAVGADPDVVRVRKRSLHRVSVVTAPPARAREQLENPWGEARRKLDQLNQAAALEDPAVPRANRLAKLRGDRNGQWALLREDVVEPAILKVRLSSVQGLPGKQREAAESLLPLG